MNLRLREVTNEDLPLMKQWLHADHVRSAWGDPDANLLLLCEPPAHGAWRAINWTTSNRSAPSPKRAFAISESSTTSRTGDTYLWRVAAQRPLNP